MTIKRDKLAELVDRYTKEVEAMMAEIKALEDEIVEEETANGSSTVVLFSVDLCEKCR